MSKINKIVSSILLFTSCVTAQAQVVDENFFGKRTELVQKYKTTKPFVLGIYNSNNKRLDMNQTTSNFLPFSNYLSYSLNRLVVVDVDKSYYNLNKELLENMNALYTSTLLSADLKKLNWKAVVVHNKLINPVFVVSTSENIKEIKDLKDKKIALLDTQLNDITIYDLIKKNVFVSKEATQGKYLVVDGDARTLFKKLEDKQVDAIVLTEAEAKKYAEGNSSYKIIKSTVNAYDMALYVSPNLSEVEIQQLKSIFLGFTSDNAKVKTLLESINELSEEKNQFIEYNENMLTVPTEIFKLIKTKDILKK